MQDKYIICRDCKNEFLFTAEKQQKFKDLGFTEPKRCYDCREAKKARETKSTHHEN